MNKSWVFLFFRLFSDAFLINLSFILGCLIKFRTGNVFGLLVLPYIKTLMFVTVFWLIIFNLAGTYKLQKDRVSRVDNAFAVSFGIFSAAFLTYIMVVYLYKEAIYSREIVLYSSVIAFSLINLSRYIIWQLYCRSEQ